MSRFLNELTDFIKTQPFHVIRVSEYHDGEIETANLCEASYCQDIYSGAKAFTMTAIGLLYDRGLIRLDDKICDIFADELPASGMDARWQLCTVEMALAHRPGLPGGFLDIDCEPSSNFGRDYLQYMLTTPLAYTPGAEERYSDGAYYLLSRIAAKKTGMTLDNFMWQELLYDLGFLEIAWSHCPLGHPIGATGLFANSADIVKLGMLYLDGGKYRGKRLLSEDWVNTVLEKQFTFEWDSTHTIFFKGGMYGQKLIVAPSQNRVVDMQSFGANSDLVADWVRAYKD